ncbi:MAG: SBBP repeat-containing protein, partial [Syntrophobacteraceae bacterium]
MVRKLGGPEVCYLFIGMPGMNKDVKIEAQEVQKGKINYFIGKDPGKWKTNIPTYKAVLYRDVYPGIDIRFYGNNRGLEYDIIVRPGANPSTVRFRYSGAKDVEVSGNGDLCVDVAGGRLIEKKPTIYQRVCGKKVLRWGRFVVREEPKVLRSARGLPRVCAGYRTYTCRFDLGPYDRNAPLVVDPSLVYSTYLGGSGQYGDSASAIASDASGNAYVTGFTSSVDFPTTSGGFQTSLRSTEWNVFVTKIASDGSSLVYSTFLGGSGFEGANGIAIDSSENAYVTGYTASTDFPTTSAAFQKKLNSTYENAFVTEISTDGSTLVYSTYLGGNGGDSAKGIVVSPSGNAYVTGITSSTDFPCTLGAFQNQLNASEGNAFVTEVAAGGANLVYSTYLGGNVFDISSSIAIDDSGNAYVTGNTYSTDFPVTAGCFQGQIKSTEGNAFVTEIAPGGSGLVYSTFLGGSRRDNGSSIAVDSSGNAYITGQTCSMDFPVTAGCFQGQIKSTEGNAFVTELAPGGAGLVYSTYLGGSAADGAQGIALDVFRNVYVTGWTRSNDFPLTRDAQETSLKSSYENGFVSEIGRGGSGLVYSTYLGGGGGDMGQGISIDSSGNGYVTGNTNSTDFPVTGGAFQTACKSSNGNCFVAKINLLINGACGKSSGASFRTAPQTNLCGSGTASSVSGTGPWTWT